MGTPAPSHLLWIDLESTGLDRQLDEIVEIAAVVTDLQLNQIGEPFHSVVLPTPVGLSRLLSNDFVREMHRANGLLNDLTAASASVKSPPSSHGVTAVEHQLIETLHSMDLHQAVFHLAGSGIASFDRPMIDRLMPTLAQHLHYAPIDVGVLRRFYKMVTGTDLVSVNNDKTHRSLDDVRCHLAEARAFAEVFQTVGSVISSGAWAPPKGTE